MEALKISDPEPAPNPYANWSKTALKRNITKVKKEIARLQGLPAPAPLGRSRASPPRVALQQVERVDEGVEITTEDQRPDAKEAEAEAAEDDPIAKIQAGIAELMKQVEALRKAQLEEKEARERKDAGEKGVRRGRVVKRGASGGRGGTRGGAGMGGKRKGKGEARLTENVEGTNAISAELPLRGR